MTDKQKMFIEYYLTTIPRYNATQAAIKAGYSPQTARVIGPENLSKPDIQEAIENRKTELLNEIKADQLSTLKEIQRCAHVDIRELYDENGNFKSIHDIDEKTAAAIAGIDFVRRKTEDGDYETVIKIRLVDKKGSLELLGRAQGLFQDTLNLNLPADVGSIRLPAKVPEGAPVEMESAPAETANK